MATEPDEITPEMVIEAARKQHPTATRFWVDEERQTWWEEGVFSTTTTLCKLWVLPKDMLDNQGRVIALISADSLAGLLQKIQGPTDGD